MPIRFLEHTRFFAFLGLVSCAAGCSDGYRGTEPTQGRNTYDTSAIQVERLAEDKNERTRVLHMSAGEAAARLGSMHFEGRSQFSFSRGTEEVVQSDRYLAHIDPNGNFRVRVDTGDSSVETRLVGETVYVRQNKGHMRRKPRRDATALDSWAQLAWASQGQSLEPFLGRLKLAAGSAEMVAGRPARRYELSLADDASPSEEVERLPASPLPVAPPSRWREIAEPRGLRGTLWVDTESGVILKSRIDGKLEIADRDVRPTVLTLRYDGEVTQAGEANPVEAPQDARPEYARTPRPVDTLSFFRDRLPAPEADESR